MSIRSLYPDIRPSLLLDFANAKQLDPRITFTRTSTATYVGADGLIKTAGIGQPRFDHDPITGESLGLLIEESRTNLITYSEEFSNTSWIKSNITITSNAIVAPDGALTGDRLDFSVTNNVPWFYKDQGTTGNSSLFVKYDNWQYVKFRSGGELNFALFDLINGTASVGGSITNASITPVGNGWFRIWANTNNQRYDFRCTNSTANDFITGSGSVFIWGAQLEAGSFPTSYIPTSGSSATRAKDDALITGGSFESWINKNEGTWLIDFRNLGSGSGLLSISATGGSVHERYMMLNIAADGIFSAAVVDGGVLQTNESILFTPTQTAQFTKAIFAVKDNDFAITANGLTPVTDTSGTVYNSPTQLRFAYGDGSSTPYAHFKTCIYYPKRLTNAQLQTLTK
jgi:hypothetical protein